MHRNAAAVFMAAAFTSIVACGDGGPSHSQVLSAWNEHLASQPCSNVNFTDVKVTGVTHQENTAEAILSVTGEYTGPSTYALSGLPVMGELFGPCAGFDGFHPGVHSVGRRLIFRKYDTGWKLEEIQ